MNIFVVVCILFLYGECVFTTHGLHLRTDSAMQPQPETDTLNKVSTCSELWNLPTPPEPSSTSTTTDIQAFCRKNHMINAEDGPIENSESEESDESLSNQVNSCCKKAETCSDAFVIYPDLCGENEPLPDRSHRLQLDSSGHLTDKKSMVSECCDEGKTCDEYELDWKREKDAWKEKRKEDEETARGKGMELPELEFESLSYCETYVVVAYTLLLQMIFETIDHSNYTGTVENI